MYLSQISHTSAASYAMPAIIYAAALVLLFLIGFFVPDAEARPDMAGMMGRAGAKEAQGAGTMGSTGASGTQQSRFAAMDENKDGKCSREEFIKGLPQIKEEAFTAMDSDKDGFLSEAEWDKAMTGHSNMPPAEGGGGMPSAMPNSMSGSVNGSMPPANIPETQQVPEVQQVPDTLTPEGSKRKMPELIMPPKKDAK